MTANILTPGHIRCLKFLNKIGLVFVGLLTSKALKGYKREVVPYKDRKFILDTIATAVGNVVVVGQDSLNPYRNIKKYRCQAIASGDGLEKAEKDALVKLGLTFIPIRFRGETTKRYSSSRIINE